MEKEKHILINSIHKFFGVEFNNKVWEYFEKKERSKEDKDDMISFAYASLVHWKLFSVGTMVNVQRGEYMISKAYALAGNKEQAMEHAKECLRVTKNHENEMKDFDIAFAYELMALVNFIRRDMKEFENYKALAEKAGNEIKDVKDREIFFNDLREDFKIQ